MADSDLPCTAGEYLKRKGCSHQILVHLKKTEKGILVNNEWAYVRTPLQAGDLLKITLTEDTPSQNIVPVAMPLSIVYEDEDILLLNKPADMPVTLLSITMTTPWQTDAAWYYAQQGKPFCLPLHQPPGPGYHGTADSGKKRPQRFYSLCSNEKKRDSQNLSSHCKRSPIPESGTIDAPIARKEGSAIERCVDFEKGDGLSPITVSWIPETTILLCSFPWKPAEHTRYGCIWAIWDIPC